MALARWLGRVPGYGAGIAFGIGAVLFALNTRLLERAGLRLAPEWIWFSTILGLLLVVMVIGACVNGRYDGIVIDNRNRVSLSKFQATLWTLLVLSAVTSAAAYKAASLGAEQTLALKIPYELIIAMGISALSFAGTPLILGAKADKSGSILEISRTADKLALDLAQVETTGLVFGRADPSDASWADMFRGDDTGNAASVDLSKVQQFLITTGLVLMYAGMLWMR